MSALGIPALQGGEDVNTTIEGLADWARERGLPCRPLSFERGLLISEAVSVGFREAQPLVVVEWGDGCRADFSRGLPIRALAYFIAGLLGITAGAEPAVADCADEKGARSVQGTAPDRTACVVGPVHSPAAALKLRSEMDAAGWAAGRVVRHYSAGAFRDEVSGR